MITFLLRRLIGAVLVLIAVSFITYLIFVKIPGGDPAFRIAGRTATQQNIQDIREKLHLDDPFYEQYWGMMKSLFSGSLVSYASQLNVVDQIKTGIPATFSLCIGAGIIWLFFGILVGVLSAVKAGRWSDRLITLLALVGVSMPVFWLGIVLRYFGAEKPNNPPGPSRSCAGPPSRSASFQRPTRPETTTNTSTVGSAKASTTTSPGARSCGRAASANVLRA